MKEKKTYVAGSTTCAIVEKVDLSVSHGLGSSSERWRVAYSFSTPFTIRTRVSPLTLRPIEDQLQREREVGLSKINFLTEKVEPGEHSPLTNKAVVQTDDVDSVCRLSQFEDQLSVGDQAHDLTPRVVTDVQEGLCWTCGVNLGQGHD